MQAGASSAGDISSCRPLRSCQRKAADPGLASAACLQRDGQLPPGGSAPVMPCANAFTALTAASALVEPHQRRWRSPRRSPTPCLCLDQTGAPRHLALVKSIDKTPPAAERRPHYPQAHGPNQPRQRLEASEQRGHRSIFGAANTP